MIAICHTDPQVDRWAVAGRKIAIGWHIKSSAMASTLHVNRSELSTRGHRPVAWVVCAGALLTATLSYALWPTLDMSLLLAFGVVFGLVGTVVATMYLARLTFRLFKRDGQTTFDALVDSLLDIATEVDRPSGLTM
jgi:hypothetical protein